MRYDEKTIIQFTVGRVVFERELDDNSHGDVGHVVGFGLNCMKEVVIDVKWADGEHSLIHPSNLYVD